jgi:hypothetical protein
MAAPSMSTGITLAPAVNASASSRRTQSPGSSIRRLPAASQTLSQFGPITASNTVQRRTRPNNWSTKSDPAVIDSLSRNTDSAPNRLDNSVNKNAPKLPLTSSR